MIRNRILWAAAVAALTAGLSACNLGKAPEPTPDVNALYTMAAETLIVQVGLEKTQTAAANSPTRQPNATGEFDALAHVRLRRRRPSALHARHAHPRTDAARNAADGSGAGLAVGCNNAVYLGQTMADKTAMTPLKQFTNGWSLQNTGTCAWDEDTPSSSSPAKD